MNSFLKGDRVMCTDLAIINGVFSRVVYGTVFRTAVQDRSVTVIVDGRKSESSYSQSFWLSLGPPPGASAPLDLCPNCTALTAERDKLQRFIDLNVSALWEQELKDAT